MGFVIKGDSYMNFRFQRRRKMKFLRLASKFLGKYTIPSLGSVSCFVGS